MQYGFVIPHGDVHTIAALAGEIEAAGWDAAFYWDGIYVGPESAVLDPWVTMAAMALATSRIRIGAILSPLSRRRPWKVARETATLDQLSHGRLILPVGLGAVESFGPFGEEADRKVRAALLDEALAILTGLWSGQPFSYQGQHYQFPAVTFLPTPAQPGGVPIWVVGKVGSKRSLGRAFRYQGLIPTTGTFETPLTPQDLRDLAPAIAAVQQERGDAAPPFDLILEGQTPTGDPQAAAAQVRPFAEAGATWWIESPWSEPNALADLRARIAQGPPR